jgi:uncharacterized repeat protein (TIGR01451 family)
LCSGGASPVKSTEGRREKNKLVTPTVAIKHGDCQILKTFAVLWRLIWGFVFYMRFSFNFRMFAAAAATLILAGTTAGAQGYFGLSVTSSANSILVSNSLTYTIYVTNLTTGNGLLLGDVQVINTLPTSVQILGTNSSQGTITVDGSVVLFDLGAIDYGTVAELILTVEPTGVGFITNMVFVSSIDVTNTAATNVVTQVTNIVTQADLGVSMTGPAQAVITNDLMTYGVTVTNLGPSAAPNVILTNTLPPGVILIFPTNQTVVNNNLIFNLSTLTDGGYMNLQFTVQPTNTGVLTFSASVGAAGVLDTNTANNSASTNITVTDYLPGTLVAVTNSAQTIDLQNGLEEQSVLLSNIGTNAVTAARVVVTGLTNRLFNSVGTNNGNPFVVYSATLGTNQSVDLLLQFSPRGSFPFTNGQLQAFAVPVPDLTPPAVSSTSTNLNITLILQLTNGNMLIEWPAITNRTYTVVYSDNVLFSNAMIAPPSIVAPANEVQWIDYGPPTTVSAPTNTSARFYRVILNP